MQCFELFGNSLGKVQHDCAPVHYAREFGMEELDRPRQSPDLSFIKHLWSELEPRFRARPSRPAQVPDLTNTLLDERAKIPTERLQKFQKTKES